MCWTSAGVSPVSEARWLGAFVVLAGLRALTWKSLAEEARAPARGGGFIRLPPKGFLCPSSLLAAGDVGVACFPPLRAGVRPASPTGPLEHLFILF